jgi:hypothetical protein
MAGYIGIVCCGDPFQFPGFKVVFIKNDIPEQSVRDYGDHQVLRDLTETERGYVEEAGNALLSSIGAIRMEREPADLGLDDYDELVAIPRRSGRDRHSGRRPGRPHPPAHASAGDSGLPDPLVQINAKMGIG